MSLSVFEGGEGNCERCERREREREKEEKKMFLFLSISIVVSISSTGMLAEEDECKH